MPLHVDIRINEDLIDTIHIGRTEVLTDYDQVSTYLVVSGNTPEWGWDDGTPFAHKYSDGPYTCVRKALEALEATAR